LGPRPDATWVLPEYADEMRPGLEMRPGVTALGRVLRGRDLSSGDNCRLDVYDVIRWSPWVDLETALYAPFPIAGARNVGLGWLGQILPVALDGLAAGTWLPLAPSHGPHVRSAAAVDAT
jgi:hypothetical protein